MAVLGGSLLFGSGFALGHLAGSTPGTAAQDQADFQPFWDAYHAITSEYVGQVDRKQLVEGAIGGLFGTLKDPFSSYMSSQDFKASLTSLAGQFEGIGASLTTRAADGTEGCTPIGPSCRLFVVSTVAKAPAVAAGLRPGAEILAVDGAAVAGSELDAVTQRIRGPAGTQVALQVQRGSAAPFELRITRAVIQEQAVESRLLAAGQVGYIRLADFSASAADDFRTQLKGLLDQGVRRIAFDLRGDPGGYVEAAQAIASQFVGTGPLFWLAYADGRVVAQNPQAGGVATDPSIQVVVLVDKGSASASEIVAAALQDSGRARLVGQTTYGKGTIQEWQTLPNDSGGFRLSVAKWLTPVRRAWIHGVGLTPDVVVVPPTGTAAGQDVVLDKAVQLLSGSASAARPLRTAA
ncbi:MAG: S41 family peptidase [Candidatus Limnocylindrales bacterium]